MKTNKTIFFKDRDCMFRFIQLYGGMSISIGWYENKYYGLQNKKDVEFMVWIRLSTDEINEIEKAIGLKKKKWNGHVCYLYE